MTTGARQPQPQLTPAQKAAQVRRVLAVLEARPAKVQFATAVARVLLAVRKPFRS